MHYYTYSIAVAAPKFRIQLSIGLWITSNKESLYISFWDNKYNIILQSCTDRPLQRHCYKNGLQTISLEPFLLKNIDFSIAKYIGH